VNKRTRQVRRSDLAGLTPIINPDAGIATKDGSVYLASVPAELAGIKEDYQRLQALVTAFPQQVQMQTTEIMGGLSALSGALEERDLRHLHRMETVEGALSEQIARMQEAILREVRQIGEQLGQRLRDQMTQTQDTLSTLLTSQSERILQQLETITATLSLQEQERRQQDQQITEQMEHRHQALISLIERQGQQDSERLATYVSNVERILHEVREEIGRHVGATGSDLNEHLESLEAAILKEMRVAEQRIAALGAIQEPLLQFLAELRAERGLPPSSSAGKPENTRPSQ
jgi:23S rRNA pseudoU1915 N3-methylase RlmH